MDECVCANYTHHRYTLYGLKCSWGVAVYVDYCICEVVYINTWTLRCQAEQPRELFQRGRSFLEYRN